VCGKRVVPPNAHVCVYPKISGKILEKKCDQQGALPLDRKLIRNEEV